MILGSTIEMLRSENIQVRSELSTIQRRMFQEKQQIMDYLRQIENDLIEKEQIKQRELLLRQEFDQLKFIHKQDRIEIENLQNSIDADRIRLEKLNEECSQLLKIIQLKDEKTIELQLDFDRYKSISERLLSHFDLPLDSIPSIDQLTQFLQDRSLSDRSIQVFIFFLMRKFFFSIRFYFIRLEFNFIINRTQ